MKPVFFDKATTPPTSIYDGKARSFRMLTKKKSGYEKFGMHISEGVAGLSGRESVETKDELVFILKGSMMIEAAGERRDLQPGQGVLIPAGLKFDWAAGPEGWQAIIVYSPPLE